MKLVQIALLAILTSSTILVGAASQAFADPSWTITCRKSYPFSSILAASIQQRVLDSIDPTLYTRASAVVRLQLVKTSESNIPVEVSVDSALNGVTLIGDPHATGLAFSVQGNADLRGAGQCVYNFVVSITTRATDIATNVRFNTATVSTLQVLGPIEGTVRKHLSSTASSKTR